MIVARFYAGGHVWSGSIERLSRHGARLVCGADDMPDRGVLALGNDGVVFEVGAEVVCRDGGGVVVVFDPLTAWQADGLELLEQGEVPGRIDVPEPEHANRPLVEVKAGWVPEVPVQQLARWQPFEQTEEDFERPVTAWRKVPTLSQEPAELDPRPGYAPTTAGGAPVDDGGRQAAAAGSTSRQSSAERRRQERVEKSIPVVFDNLTELIKEFTHNISFGGMFVYTATEYDKGQDVSVTLIHPVTNEHLTLLGRVVHRSSAPSVDPSTGRRRYGIGIEFRMPQQELKRILSDFISLPSSRPANEQSMVREARDLLERGGNLPHELLGVSEQATEAEVRRAYFHLVDRFHPDRFFGKVGPDDQAALEELFRRLTAAYEKLTQ